MTNMGDILYYFLIIGILLLIVCILISHKSQHKTNHYSMNLPTTEQYQNIEAVASAHVRNQGLAGIQIIFGRSRRMAEHYLVQKKIDISGNLKATIDNAHETGKITKKEHKNLCILKNGGNIGAHGHEAEKYVKGQGKTRYRDQNRAARELGMEPAAYL